MGSTLKNVDRYDSIRDIWESLPKLNKRRHGHSSCTLSNTLYVLGGNDSHVFYHVLDSIEKLANIDRPVPMT